MGQLSLFRDAVTCAFTQILALLGVGSVPSDGTLTERSASAIEQVRQAWKHRGSQPGRNTMARWSAALGQRRVDHLTWASWRTHAKSLQYPVRSEQSS